MTAASKYFAIVDDQGDVTTTMSIGASQPLPQLPPGRRLIEIDQLDIPESYADGDQVLPKQDYELGQLPLPCKIFIEGVEYQVTDTQPEFDFAVPGEYQIRVVPESTQFRNKEFTYVKE